MGDSDAEEFFDCDEINTKEQTGQMDNDCNKFLGNGKFSDFSNGQKSIWGGRTKLPVEMFSRNDYTLWSILKQCIGKELSKITMPLVFNEPLSFLQRVVENMEYACLLSQANKCNDPIRRQELVTAFASSVTASNWERLGKPFNPLLGETFEYHREDMGYSMVCEQVSHHPPVSAFYAESPEYILHGSIHPKLKFWGKSVEVTPKGLATLYLKKHDEYYSWQNVNCCVHNVIIGKIWIEHYGDMEVVNHKMGWKSLLNFHPCGWFGRDLHRVDGYVQDEKKNKLRCFCGKWIDSLYSFDPSDWSSYLKQVSNNGKTADRSKSQSKEGDDIEDNPPEIQAPLEHDDDISDELPIRKVDKCHFDLQGLRHVWSIIPKPPHANKYYSFTYFAMTLNEPLDDMSMTRLPPTDCRFRPDMRKMEDGFLDDASWEKNRLEEKQREARREMKRTKEEFKPVWFKMAMNRATGKEDWMFDKNYWKRDWSRCPDIF